MVNWLKSSDWLKGEKKKEKVVFLGDTRKPKVVEIVKHQNGKTNLKRDKVRNALPSGKRISKSGNVYYEYRKNRSDMIGEKV